MVEADKSKKNKIIFIINPIAGTKQKQIIHDAIIKYFTEDEFEVYYTAYRGHAYVLAAEKAAAGYTGHCSRRIG
jgi:diacylglycerol kinase family enzyme